MIKRVFFSLFGLLVVIGMVWAQEEIKVSAIGVDTAQQSLKEIKISDFEDAGFWSASIPQDDGLIVLKRLVGRPKDKKEIPDEAKLGIATEDKYVLGLKVYFYRRGFHSFSVFPARPLPIEGISKTISVWVVGRNVNHTLKILIEDAMGVPAEISMGKLNFSGWRQVTVAIPPTIVQRDYHYSNRNGIKILGFKVDCDPAETFGQYYVYFDGLTAVTDLFAEESRDVDDMQDGW